MRPIALILIVTFAVTLPSQSHADWLNILGNILTDTSGHRSGKALDCLKREAGYRALDMFLEGENVAGAHYFVEAVKAAVERDYSEATVILRMGLDESNLKLEAGVELLNASAVIVRPASSEVADKIEGLTQYVSNR
jgi:hypothetical protein